MTFNAGTKLGAYEILKPIGAGGMGAVYKARDTRLNRDVAIKILSDAISSHPEARQRFEREAQAIAGLKHPNICVLYDVGRQDGIDFLVMEYIEGETLAERLARGPLPLDQALKVAIEISDALDKAHRQGITHRDLKPGNIMLTKSGSKLLDFGLAKLQPDTGLSSASALPTNAALTGQGMILGTLQYMAPEQIEGADTDGRSDIFSFGTVLYETITGKKAFEGRSQASLIAAILQVEPPAPSALVPMAPAALDHVVRRCLAKDPDARWQSANDLTNELQWIVREGLRLETPAHAANKNKSFLWTAVVVAVVIGAFTLGAWRSGRSPADQTVLKLSVMPPEQNSVNLINGSSVISPDGKRIVFPGNDGDKQFLYLRNLDSVETETLFTDGNVSPFWSPDSRFVAFIAQGKLKKVELSSKAVQDICDMSDNEFFGGSWNSDGTILLALHIRGPLSRVPASGGVPESATALDDSKGEIAHWQPFFLPDGKHFLYVIRSSKPENTGIYAGSLDSRESKQLLKVDSMAVYGSGHLLFMRGRTLMAQAFDAQRLELSGEAVPVAQRVDYFSEWDQGSFSVSETGVLAYSAGGSTPISQLTWVNRQGNSLGTVGSSFHYGLLHSNGGVELSPDEKRAAVERTDTDLLKGDLFIVDLLSGVPSRLTLVPAWESSPAWSPNGDRIAYTVGGALGELYIRDSKGAGKEEGLLVDNTTDKQILDWSGKGDFILFERQTPKTHGDIWLLPLSDPAKARPLIQSVANQLAARFSPDEKWIAYASDQSGKNEVYVQSFPAGDGRWQISSDGGAGPRWRGDSKEVYYVRPDGTFMAAALNGSSTFQSVVPQALFKLPPTHGYDVTKDGQRFLINMPVGDPAAWPITIVVNWPASIKR